MKKAILLFLVSICVSSAAFGQPAADLAMYRKMFSGADAVFLQNNRSVLVTLVNHQLKISDQTYEELFLLSENASSYSERSVGYSDFNPLVALQARTMIPDKDKYKSVEANNIVNEKPEEEDVFYDDDYSKKIYYPDLQAGAKRILSYTLDLKMPQLLPSFYFQHFAPCVSSTYTITLPKDVNINYKLFNIKDGQVKFAVQQKGSQKIYTWTAQNLKAIDFESDAPDPRYYLPHIVVYFTNYIESGKDTKILPDTDALYHWYWHFIGNLNRQPSAQLQPIVDSLIKNKTDEMAKVRSIFYWVQDHIRYIAFEKGMEGYVPFSADSVCRNRYGDCKGMASILTAMLTAAHIDNHITWIGSREIPYTYEEIPSPLVDDHMICTYIHNGKYYFLDGTSRFLPFGMPSDFIENKEALIALDSLHYKIMQVPIVPYGENAESDTLHLQIVNNTLTGIAGNYFTGYTKQDFNYLMDALSNKNLKRAMQSYLMLGNNKFKLDTFSFGNISDRDKKSNVDFRFELPDYIQNAGNEIYLSLDLKKTFQNDFIDTSKRKIDRQSDNTFQQSEHYVFTLPAGYEVEYLPANAEFRNEQFGFSIHYEQSGNTITFNKQVYSNYLILKPVDFPKWNQMIKAIDKSYGDLLILKKKTG